MESTTTNVKRVMSLDEAADMLNLSKATLQYHIRHGRIRRAVIPGARKACGVVADDILAIATGRTNGGYDTRVIHARG